MKSLYVTLLSLIMLLMLFGSAGFVLAQEDSGCACWCKTSDGAQQVEGKETVGSSTECRSACNDSGWGYSMCSTNGSSPADNDKCWSQYECENNVAKIDGEEVPYEWDTRQAEECISGERYCYRPAEAVELSVLIGETTEVDSIADYINVAYNFLLPAGALLAVLMLMIAGLQYMVARGNPDRIGKAKTRIRNAVTGIILLLLAATFAQFMDPALTHLNRLTPPAIRTVVFIDPDSTCEAMTEAGLTITADISGQESCGDTGTVTDTGEIETTVKVGDSCNFSGCEGDYEVCVGTAESDTGYDCLRCSGVYTTLTSTVGGTPSSSMCGRLGGDQLNDDVQTALASAGDRGRVFACKYYDAEFFSEGFNTCVEYSYPEGEDYLDCDALWADALADDSAGCRAYDEVGAAYEYEAMEALWNTSILSFAYDPSYVNEIDDLQGSNDFDLLEDLCVSDPCGLAPPGEKCRVFTNETPEDEIYDEAYAHMNAAEMAALEAVLLADNVSDFLGGASAESFANCANESSAYGLYYCLDEHGDEVDCNWTW